MQRLLRIAFLLPAALSYGCGGDDDSCDPVSQDGCGDGYVCELVDGQEEPACFEPVLVKGSVFDLGDDSAIAAARIVGLDANSSPVSSVAISDEDGEYELAIPTTRTADGTPMGYDVTLRADAASYQTFPGGVRPALPVDTTTAVRDGGTGPWVVQSALTDIGLIGLPADAGTASIHGTAEVPADRIGTLVVAEGTDGTGYSAIADRDGDYTIFNLPADDYVVQGYARYVNYDPVEVSVAADDDSEVDLSLNDTAASTVTGSVQFADPGDTQGTSIILVVKSTFDGVLQRGQTPPGLRAPDPGIAPDLNEGDSFSIEGVPEGEYYVLAAFENDSLVRDPDPCIAGTDLVVANVGAATTVSMDQQFKITGALDIYSPGAEGPEAVSGEPTFTWENDSSEEAYQVVVMNSFGEVVWETQIDGVPSGDVSLAYAGDPLEPGMYYQLRVTSLRMLSEEPVCKISTTEDLKGVFYLE